MSPTSNFPGSLPSHSHPTQLQCWPGGTSPGQPQASPGKAEERAAGCSGTRWPWRSRAGQPATWPKVALATCTELKTALEKSSFQPGTALRAQHRAGEQAPDIHYTAVPGPQSEGGQLPGKGRRSQNKGGCCLIHNKDNFLKLVQP